jgi:hypothetical protein
MSAPKHGPALPARVLRDGGNAVTTFTRQTTAYAWPSARPRRQRLAAAVLLVPLLIVVLAAAAVLLLMLLVVAALVLAATMVTALFVRRRLSRGP